MDSSAPNRRPSMHSLWHGGKFFNRLPYGQLTISRVERADNPNTKSTRVDFLLDRHFASHYLDP